MNFTQTTNSWNEKLLFETTKPYFNDLIENINTLRKTQKIYPAKEEVFNAFNFTSFEKLKVVIIGQDPYHGPNQAHGLSFSVNNGVKIPPSLKNIFKELNSDLGIDIPSNGNLTNWAKQGVLLLNATLTVKESEPGSHQKMGWETFTDAVIQTISKEKSHCVFLLWGNFAKSKVNLIDLEKHLVLQSAHPSPLARGGFFGNHHFSKTNAYLQSKGQTPINWSLNTPDLFSI